MSDEPQELQGEVGDQMPPKKRAEDNAWYLLATLYGVPGDRALREKNRVTWNRYFAARLREIDEQSVSSLIDQNPQLWSELTPFTEEELTRIKIDYARRCNASSQCTQLPNSSGTVKFVDVQFDDPVSFEGFLFPDCSFEHTVFSRGVHARFNNASFMRLVSFKNAKFYDEAHFNSINFLAGQFGSAPNPEMDFSGATFCRQAFFEGAKFKGMVLFTDHVTFGADDMTDSEGIWFRGAAFLAEANFTGAIFHCEVSFDKAFFQWPKFNGTTFMRDVWSRSSPARHTLGAQSLRNQAASLTRR